MQIDQEKLAELVKQDAARIEELIAMMGRRLVGQRQVAERLVMALIGGGHVLLEGLPGLAKTTAVKALCDASDLSMSRIQFTPDLLPADVVGTQIYDPKKLEFGVKKGPIFANLVIADEINRAPAKVQSALLQAMQEKQVTIGGQTFDLESPFMVMATQNPIEQEGTYSLPEAQVDRFLFKVNVQYGTLAEEIVVVDRMYRGEEIPLNKILAKKDIDGLRSRTMQVHVADKIRDYIVRLVFATREPKHYGLQDLANLIAYGASPRASINLEIASRLNAQLRGRSYVTPQDVKDVGADVLRHRVILTYEAEAENVSSDEVVKRVFARVDVP